MSRVLGLGPLAPLAPLALVALVALVALFVLWSTSPAAAQKKGRAYVVQPGDSCWSIAEKVFGKGSDYKIIHRYNTLGALPHVLTPGQIIRLPGKGTSPDATVGWLKREVKAKSPKSPAWRSAKRAMGLWRLYKVSTGDQSAAGIEFEDASHLRLRQNALLVIYGSTAGKSRLAGGVRKKTVILERGTVRGGHESLDRPTDLREPGEPPVVAKKRHAPAPVIVKTPSSKVMLTAEDAQVQVDKVKRSIISVFKGLASVSAAGATVKVPENHGTTVKKGKRPEKPRKLPPRPKWAGDAKGAVVLVAPGGKGRYQARWRKTARAARYRVEVARDARFRKVTFDAIVGKGVTGFRTDALTPGQYWVRVAAIDSSKLEGRPAKALKLDVVELTSSHGLRQGKGGILEVVGLARLELGPKTGTATLEVAVGDGAFRRGRIVRLRKPGLYPIRARRVGASRVSTLRVRVLAVHAKVTCPEGERAPGAELQCSVELTDERQRPAALPGLRVDGSAQARLTPDGRGRWITQLKAPDAHAETMSVRATWAGGPLGEAAVRTTEAPQPEVVASRQFEWRPSPPVWEAARPGAGLPTRAARPLTHVGLSAFVAGTQGSGSAPRLRLALRGELAIGPVGLDLDVPWYHANPGADAAESNEMGDLRVGTRVVVLEKRGITLAPSLRITVPTGGGSESLRLEPGLLVDWEVAPWVTLGTNQILLVATDLDETWLAWAGSVQAAFRALPWLSLGAGLELAIPFFGAEPDVALSASGVVWFHLGRARIGLVAGGPLTSAARASLGTFSAGLTLDLGFDGP